MMRRNEEAEQFELVVDGRVVSVIGYEVRAGKLLLLHTATEPDARNRGHATALAGEVLRELESSGTPYSTGCRFVRAYIARQAGTSAAAAPAGPRGSSAG